MASLFTPESERLRAGAAKAEQMGRTSPQSMRVPGMKTLEGQKSGDSLGNPNSPGYEPWGKKKPAVEEEKLVETGPAGAVFETPKQGPEFIRLALGWDKILLAQKKLCEKAKNLFTILEGPEKYRAQRKGRLFNIKSRGCIVDLDSQETQDQLQTKEKDKTSA